MTAEEYTLQVSIEDVFDTLIAVTDRYDGNSSYLHGVRADTLALITTIGEMRARIAELEARADLTDLNREDE